MAQEFTNRTAGGSAITSRIKGFDGFGLFIKQINDQMNDQIPPIVRMRHLIIISKVPFRSLYVQQMDMSISIHLLLYDSVY